MIFTLVAVGVDVLMPLLTKAAIDHATGVVDDGLSLRTVIIALVVFAVVRYACHLGRRVFAGRLAVNVQNTLRLRLLDTLLHLDGRSQHQIRTGHQRCVNKPPRIGVKHWDDGQHTVGLAD